MLSESGKSRSAVNHPVHILDQNDQLMPSALIPFCAIGSNTSILGTKVENFTQPVCTKFRPVVLEGQLCYQLDLQHSQEQIRFKKGERHGLTFLMDFNEDRSINDASKLHDEALIYIVTLGSRSHDY